MLVELRLALQSEELVLYNPFLVRLHPSIEDRTHANHQRVLGVLHRTEQGVVMDLEVVNLEESQRVRHAHAARHASRRRASRVSHLHTKY